MIVRDQMSGMVISTPGSSSTNMNQAGVKVREGDAKRQAQKMIKTYLLIIHFHRHGETRLIESWVNQIDRQYASIG